MKAAAPKQMNEIDRAAISRVGLPGIVLMENAAIRIFDEVKKILVELPKKRTVVFAGKGNNGGDAFAVARHLHNNDVITEIYITCSKSEITGDSGINLKVIENMGIVPKELSENILNELSDSLKNADIIIDGIFGTGFKGEIKGIIKDAVCMINSSGKTVLSIDIPSGVNGTTGEVSGACIRAARTVTLCLPKTGIIIHPGCEYAGELVVADIGIPPEIMDKADIRTNTIDTGHISKLLPARKADSNKGDFGKVFIVTGSPGMTGAGCLSGKAALRSGAGLVYLGVPKSLSAIYDSLLIESVTVPLEDNGTGHISRDSIKQVLSQLKRSTVTAVGPGLSVSKDTIELVGSIIENSEAPLVLDADALNALSKDISVLKKCRGEVVITPHPGEMARLLSISIDDVQNNRIETAREFALKWNVITILKGSRTVVAFPEGTTYINLTGNSGMATGGTGDVLTGILAGLIGQGVKPADAALIGVHIHGLAGDRAAASKGECGLIAGDLIEELPYAIKQLRRMKAE